MSTLKINSLQLGQSSTAAQNFTWTAASADGTCKLQRGNQGAPTQDILTVAVDGTVDFPTGLTSMSGTNRSFTGQGWQNLPGGLILQWGTCTYLASYGAAGQVFNLPKAFPNGVLSLVGCDAGSGAHRVGMQPLSKSTFSAWGGAYTGYLDTTIRYIAIGY